MSALNFFSSIVYAVISSGGYLFTSIWILVISIIFITIVTLMLKENVSFISFIISFFILAFLFSLWDIYFHNENIIKYIFIEIILLFILKFIIFPFIIFSFLMAILIPHLTLKEEKKEEERYGSDGFSASEGRAFLAAERIKEIRRNLGVNKKPLIFQWFFILFQVLLIFF
ncbi:MAG: hypothetical protein PHH98_05465 [Candidatus Gracilibacteria bacterium]|nr:hypothetical protein [Candidatus Gracilibacteria bacterium]